MGPSGLCSWRAGTTIACLALGHCWMWIMWTPSVPPGRNNSSIEKVGFTANANAEPHLLTEWHGNFKRMGYTAFIIQPELSPAMGARNRVGVELSYHPASLCSLASQFHTRLLESIPSPIAEPEFGKLLRSRGIDSQSDAPARQAT